MQEQFTYRELSEKLDINIAKLKRWGREFLPPDYSAGQSQGVARVLTTDEAFILYLSGHLVSVVKYSIPETKKIMDLMVPYLREKKAMPSMLSMKELAKYDWEIRILFYPERDEVNLISEMCVNTIMYKEVEVPHKEFDVLRHRVEEHKIIEKVAKHHNNEYQKITENYVLKFLHISTTVLAFLSKVRGSEVIKEWVLEKEITEHFVHRDSE